MVEVFPAMSSGVRALGAGSGSGEHYFQQDLGMDMNNEWNQGFSSDFLPLPQPQEAGNSAPFQFAFNNQQDFSNQGSYTSVPQSGGQQAQYPGGQQYGYQAGMASQQGQQFGNQQQGFG